MNLILKHGLILNVAMAAFPVYLVGFGLHGILTKKVYVVSTRRAFWILPLLFVPLLLFSGGLASGSRGHSFNFTGLLFPLVFFGVVLLAMWKARGYSIWGATEEYLQNALRAALRELNLPFEESVARLRLTSLNADLFISVSGFGAAQMRLEESRHGSTLKQIADSMNAYFATVPGKVNLTAFYVEALMGALLLTQQMTLILGNFR